MEAKIRHSGHVRRPSGIHTERVGTPAWQHLHKRKSFESNYEATFKDLQYAKDLNGRTLDTALLLEAAHAYAQIPQIRKSPTLVWKNMRPMQDPTAPSTALQGASTGLREKSFLMRKWRL